MHRLSISSSSARPPLTRSPLSLCLHSPCFISVRGNHKIRVNCQVVRRNKQKNGRVRKGYAACDSFTSKLRAPFPSTAPGIGASEQRRERIGREFKQRRNMLQLERVQRRRKTRLNTFFAHASDGAAFAITESQLAGCSRAHARRSA